MITAKALRRLALITATAALALGAFSAPAASAACPPHEGLPFGVTPGCFDGLALADESGALAATQAGIHPFAITSQIQFNTTPDPAHEDPEGNRLWPTEPVRNIFADLPPGLIGNPKAASQCSIDQLAAVGGLYQCPASSQVGVASIDPSACPDLCAPIELAVPGVFLNQPIYSMVPPPGVPARFAFNVAGSIITFDAAVRSDGDYGFTAAFRNTPEALPLLGSTITFWGDPADESHTPLRYCPGEGSAGPRCKSDATEPQAFLRLPTSCTGPQPTVAHLDSWFNSGAFNPDGSPDLSDPNWKEASFLSHKAEAEGGEPVGTTGCEQVPFEPEIAVRPTNGQADSPTGLEVDISVPQDELINPAPGSIAQSDLKDAVVRLPEGMSVNPSQADGLGACSLAQIDLHSRNTEPTCPDSSKIGTVAIRTPLLEEELEGTVYLAAQKDNPFDSLLALYIVAEARGQVVKLAGEVEPTASGRLVTSFENQPQLPFETLHLRLKGGPRAALINPPACGPQTATATLTPWSGNPPVEVSSSFTLTSGPNGSPCPSKPLGFDPKLNAGSQIPIAGTFSPFSLRLTREDATQRLTGLSATPPSGLLASLKGVTYCPDATLAAISGQEGTGAAQIANPSCPVSSQVGTVTAGAGAGATPFFTDKGRAYLAGPYKGAPLSLAVVAPAVAGPFDLGSVVVRNALRIDPETAKITAVSDPIPTILHGIPLDLRDLRVNLDRPNFTLNPTSCEPMSVDATVSGDEGASANVSDQFQLGECGRLAFKPHLTLRLKGKTKRSGHPALRATLTMPTKTQNANIARVSVALPHSEFLAQNHIRTICTRVQFTAGGGGGEQCPKGSVYGHARAFTPLLDQPLEGPVYLRSSDHPLPDLVASLGGQIHIDLVGRIDAPHGGIRNTFELVPDAPVSKFVLTMQGGKKGLLENSTDLCRLKHRATALFDAQNGKLGDSRPVLKVHCGRR